MAGFNDRLEHEQKARVWLAWHTAALGRVKSLPSLKKMLDGGEPKAPVAQSETEMLSNLRAWNMVINGPPKAEQTEG